MATFGQAQQGPASAYFPQPSRKPRHFTGVDLMEDIVGHCDTVVDDGYKYKLCHFDNITQAEDSLRSVARSLLARHGFRSFTVFPCRKL